MLKEPILYIVVRPIITLFFKLVYRPTIRGVENIPKTDGLVLAGNHTNNLDCFLIISCTKRTVHFLAKDELIKGIKKFIFIPMGIIPVNRKIHDKGALNRAIDTLKNNKVIGIFPEGTINRTKDLILPFKFGAVKMSKESESLIVPFVISGEYKKFKKGIEIEFLNPYYVKDDLDKENKKLEKIISNGIRERRK